MSARRRLVPIVVAGLVLLGCAAGPSSAASRTTDERSTATVLLAGMPAAATTVVASTTAPPTTTASAAQSGGATSTAAPTAGPPAAGQTPGGAPLPSDAPTPTGTPAPTGTPPTGAAAAPAPTASPGTLHPVDVGGVLFVSGVTTSLHPSWDPLGGTLHVEMTVRNATDQVIDASASLGATTLLGVDLGGSDSIPVRGLAPGEIRTIGTDIGGVGQWGVLTAHLTLTPPAQLRGVELAPLARERWVLAPPWYAIGLLAALGVVVRVFRRYRLGLVPRRMRNGRTRPFEPGSSSFPVVIP